MNSTGDIAEVAFIHEIYKRGYQAYIPFSHDSKIDLIIKKARQPIITVQIKKGTLQKAPANYTPRWKAVNGSIKSSSKRLKKDTPRFTKYEPNDFDILALYIMETDQWILHRLKDIGDKSSISWTVKKPADNWDLLETITK